MSSALPASWAGQQEAELVLVTSGLRRSSACHMPAVSSEPVVLFNTPGTTPHDCFELVGGRFVSLSIQAPLWNEHEGRPASSRGAHRLGVGAMACAYRHRAQLARWDFASPLEHKAGR